MAFWAHDQKNSKKVFSLFLSPPCRETPKNAIKTFLKQIKKEKKVGGCFFESLSGKCAWVFVYFFFAAPRARVDQAWEVGSMQPRIRIPLPVRRAQSAVPRRPSACVPRHLRRAAGRRREPSNRQAGSSSAWPAAVTAATAASP